MSDPTDSTRESGLNNEEILIRVTGNGVIAIWKSDDSVTNVDPKELVPIIKKMLDCTDDNKKVENGKCVYSLEEEGKKKMILITIYIIVVLCGEYLVYIR